MADHDGDPPSTEPTVDYPLTTSAPTEVVGTSVPSIPDPVSPLPHPLPTSNEASQPLTPHRPSSSFADVLNAALPTPPPESRNRVPAPPPNTPISFEAPPPEVLQTLNDNPAIARQVAIAMGRQDLMPPGERLPHPQDVRAREHAQGFVDGLVLGHHTHSHSHSHAPPPMQHLQPPMQHVQHPMQHVQHRHAHSHSHSHAPPPMPHPPHPQMRPIQAHRQRTIRVPPAQAIAQANQPSNQLGAVRDRLFQAMLVRMALWYTARINRTWRRIIEFVALTLAILSFFSLAVIHGMFMRVSTNCLKDIETTWPRDGVIRVELVRNLAMLRKKEEQFREYRTLHMEELARQPPPVCQFSTKEVFTKGPYVIPPDIRELGYIKLSSSADTLSKGRSIFGTVIGYIYPDFFDQDVPVENEEGFDPRPLNDDDLHTLFDNEFNSFYEPDELPYFEYRVEYSLLYGLLRLPKKFIEGHNISVLVKQIDAGDECLGSPSARWLMANLVGYDDPILHTLKALAVNESDIAGYVHDLRSNDHYHFVQLVTTKMSYVTACVVMMLFTFAISLLLRFSHHQIFLFIVDLLHMFEHNQPLSFPAAPLLTVILALVGMEAIMSEVFNDTTTAFYVILIVWLADQFDAICCQSPTSKRYWLRFFYLHQFFFYSYQYRFGGIYGGLALLTSSLFIMHSMIYFFHHYEIPLILYTDRLQRIMGELSGRIQDPPLVQEVNLASDPNGNNGNGGAAPPPPPPPPPPPQVAFGGVRRMVLPRGGPQREVIGVPIDGQPEIGPVVGLDEEQRPGDNTWSSRINRAVGSVLDRVVGRQRLFTARIDQVPGEGSRMTFHLTSPQIRRRLLDAFGRLAVPLQQEEVIQGDQ